MNARKSTDINLAFWIISILFIAVAFGTVERVLKFGEETNPFIYELLQASSAR